MSSHPLVNQSQTVIATLLRVLVIASICRPSLGATGLEGFISLVGALNAFWYKQPGSCKEQPAVGSHIDLCL